MATGDSIEDLFPGLTGTAYRVTSPADDTYNCIAWAAGAADDWWWPDPGGSDYWPPGIVRAETVEAFRDAFLSLGYQVCADEQLEAGVEKVVLFADVTGFPLHTARQLANGQWTSKLGELEDIEHGLRAIEGMEYGSVLLLLKRQLTRVGP